jgi:DMSO/TMAO reductase YedYZ heme-binding membrane subunit
MRAGKNNFADVWIYATIIVMLLAWRVMRKLKTTSE